MRADFHRGTERPQGTSATGWRPALHRVVRAFIDDDDLWSVSAGVAFYAWFATVFGVVFLVSLYGLGVQAGTVRDKIDGLNGLMPEGAVRFLADQMQSVAGASGLWRGTRLAGAFLVALWSGRAAAATLIAALNITHNDREDRGFWHLQFVTLAVTAGAAMFGTAALALAAFGPAAVGQLPAGAAMKAAISLARWPTLAALMGLTLAMLYRFAPCRRTPQWRWVSGGAAAGTALWISGSAGFSWYVTSFSASNKAFGALSAVLVMQTWFYITALAVLLGAKLNAEAEHETSERGGAG